MDYIKNVNDLRTFLGLVNYYQKFLPNLASKLHPINKLLRKDIPFTWNSQCEKVFTKLKKEISSDKVLIPYTPEPPLILATDASPTGLGAVISHVLPDKSERPIAFAAFASRSLTDSEKNYSQIDKESTAIVWGLKKFFHYCYGREIILMTDHKPLTRILRPEKDYASFMAGFKYEIIYRNTKEHANADYLSRFALHHTKTETLDEEATILKQKH
ncbi:RNase H-like domain found in reverse transcriptase [Popillia japonica]|uniref:RNase H-like domain found in reverse transcriptase n=1 Tax=Popillia japonica TaxID=7064 RepID=A0AAW1JF06_POPJA